MTHSNDGLALLVLVDVQDAISEGTKQGDKFLPRFFDGLAKVVSKCYSKPKPSRFDSLCDAYRIGWLKGGDTKSNASHFIQVLTASCEFHERIDEFNNETAKNGIPPVTAFVGLGTGTLILDEKIFIGEALVRAGENAFYAQKHHSAITMDLTTATGLLGEAVLASITQQDEGDSSRFTIPRAKCGLLKP